MKNLTDLGIVSQIPAAAVKEMAALKNLTHLDFSSDQLDDEGFKTLGSLDNLKLLTFRAPRVTEAAVAELKHRLPNCEIRK